MKNEIIYVSAKTMEGVKKDLRRNNATFLVEIEGKDITSFSEYTAAISNLCCFPIPAKRWSLYEDWMRDFSWIQEDSITVVINNFREFLSADPSSKEAVTESFREVILPWWQEEVIHHVVGGKPKKFMVYLVE